MKIDSVIEDGNKMVEMYPTLVHDMKRELNLDLDPNVTDNKVSFWIGLFY